MLTSTFPKRMIDSLFFRSFVVVFHPPFVVVFHRRQLCVCLPKEECVLKISSRRRSAPLNGPKPNRFNLASPLQALFVTFVKKELDMNQSIERITINPNVFNGRPTIRNMSFTVAQLHRKRGDGR